VNGKSPFQPSDLDELGKFLDRAYRVYPMEVIAAMQSEDFPDPMQADVIGMRHDVDNTIAPAVAMAQWEAERGYCSTYFILHTAPYWEQKETLKAALEVIADCGHEIGFHINAITSAIKTGRDPIAIAAEAVGELRSYGHNVHGVVAHGDNACYQFNFINDEIFTESARPAYGASDRSIAGTPVRLNPISRLGLGFDYDPNWLSRGCYISDSGGEWSTPWDEVAARFPSETGQLHMLVHPDWWGEAFVPLEAVA
jgi:hypothetical protein